MWGFSEGRWASRGLIQVMLARAAFEAGHSSKSGL
jgi:hypothetical protein